MKLLINKIQDFFFQIRNDLHLHFEFTLFISFIISKLLNLTSLDKYSSAAISSCITILIGISKEVFIDKILRGEYIDITDIKADIIGAVTGSVQSLI